MPLEFNGLRMAIAEWENATDAERNIKADRVRALVTPRIIASLLRALDERVGL